MEQLRAYAVRRIKEEIPREILQHTFYGFNLNQQLNQFVTLDTAIASAILEGSVFMDIFLISGRETNIDLTSLELIRNLDNTVTINVPLAVTGGREILEVYRVNYRDHTQTYNGPNYGNTSEVEKRLDQLIDSESTIPVTSTSQVSLIAPNTLLIHYYDVVPSYLSATVNLAIDKNLGHIPPKAFHVFGNLVVEKAKQYIYNKQVINLDRGMINRGAELASFRDIILEYRDAHLNYRDLLVKWRRKEFHFDGERKDKFIKLIAPRLL